MSEHAIGIVVDLRGETCRELLVRLCRMDLEEFPLEKSDLVTEIEEAYMHEARAPYRPEPEYEEWLEAVLNSKVPPLNPQPELVEAWLRDSEMHEALSTEAP